MVPGLTGVNSPSRKGFFFGRHPFVEGAGTLFSPWIFGNGGNGQKRQKSLAPTGPKNRTAKNGPKVPTWNQPRKSHPFFEGESTVPPRNGTWMKSECLQEKKQRPPSYITDLEGKCHSVVVQLAYSSNFCFLRKMQETQNWSIIFPCFRGEEYALTSFYITTTLMVCLLPFEYHFSSTKIQSWTPWN